MLKILAIESSCDETAAALVGDGHLVLSDAVATQIDIHRKYGGVVPELASRNHLVDAIPVVEEALTSADATWNDVDAMAVTRGPGLVGSLLVGLQVAKALAYAKQKPLIPVHHLQGHMQAVFLHKEGEPRPESPGYPHVALAVSGGHTALYLVSSPTQIRQIAHTRDDAAGEAFDKVSRMLGLGYPGGPIVERGAKGGNEKAFKFTRPHFKDGDPLDFSFSGLKTAVLTVLKKFGAPPEGQDLADLLASFQHAVCDQLVERTLEAAKHFGCKHAVLAGGVACNGALRRLMQETLSGEGIALHMPRPRWCTDNAAMIGAAAWHRDQVPGSRLTGEALRSLNAVGNWDIGENL